MNIRKSIFSGLFFIVLGCILLLHHPQAVSAETTSTDGNYVYVEHDGRIIIKEYLGTETVLHIPETIDGKTVGYTHADFTGVRELYLPKTVTGVYTTGETLENIYVDPENTCLFAVDGILYRKDAVFGSVTLEAYPLSHAGEVFVVPGFVDKINDFFLPDHLKTLVINSNVTYIYLHAIFGRDKTHDIYLNMEDPTKVLVSTDNSILSLGDGSRIFVKNEAARQAVQKSVDNKKQSRCGEVEVINIAENPQYAIPAESLTFQDGTTEQNLSMSPNEKKKLTGVCKQLPFNSTECVTWASSDESIAVIEENKVVAKKNGVCDITGKNESGMQVVYHLKVSETVQAVEAEETDTVFYYLKNYGTYSEESDFDMDRFREIMNGLEQQESNIKYIYREGDLGSVCSIQMDFVFDGKYSAYQRNPGLAVSCTSSNPQVAAVTEYTENDWSNPHWSDDREQSSRSLRKQIKLTGQAGTADITLTVTDGTNVYTGTSHVTVKEDPFEGNCTKYYELEDFQIGIDGAFFSVKDGDYPYLNKMLTVGYPYQLKVTGDSSTPVSSLRQEWEVDDPQTVQLTAQGDGTYCLTMLKEGTATLTVTIYDRDRVVKKSYPLKTRSSQNPNSPSVTPGSGGNSTVNGSGTTVTLPDSTVQNPATDNSQKNQDSQTAAAKPSVKKTAVKSVRASGKKALTIRWKKISGASGYQIQTSVKKTMKAAKTLTVKKNILTAKAKGLKSGKKYYVRVRAYKTVSGKKVYGKWSSVKSGRTK